MVDKKNKTVNLFELTVPFETRIDEAHKIKLAKYQHFNLDLQTNGYTPNIEPFEIGSRGHVTKNNEKTLKQIHKFCNPDIKFKSFLNNISSLAVQGSYYLFISRKEAQWSDTNILEPSLRT